MLHCSNWSKFPESNLSTLLRNVPKDVFFFKKQKFRAQFNGNLYIIYTFLFVFDGSLDFTVNMRFNKWTVENSKNCNKSTSKIYCRNTRNLSSQSKQLVRFEPNYPKPYVNINRHLGYHCISNDQKLQPKHFNSNSI